MEKEGPVTYQVKEIFASIKGEGRWLGYPMIFIRLAECNLACEGCDTEFGDPYQEMGTAEILEEIKKYSTLRRIVITGGEPTLQPLYDLGIALQERGYLLHLETNGTNYQTILENFDWIAFSPKRLSRSPDLRILGLAREVKVPISRAADFAYAENLRETSPIFVEQPLWYLHPWNALPGDLRTMESVDREVGKMCVDYAITTGRWLVSIQAHKYLGIK